MTKILLRRGRALELGQFMTNVQREFTGEEKCKGRKQKNIFKRVGWWDCLFSTITRDKAVAKFIRREKERKVKRERRKS